MAANVQMIKKEGSKLEINYGFVGCFLIYLPE